jgi:hypothetical protein
VNFLEICQRAQRECGIATTLTTVVGQSGEHRRFVDWVQDAWNDIQTVHQDWEWLRQSVSFVTVNGQATYTPLECGITAGTFGMWARDSFRSYETAGGVNTEMTTSYIGYEDWRQLYQLGAHRDTRSRPVQISITPAKSIALAPYPADGYTVTGDYYTAPVVLALDADTPLLPAQFHMAVVWKACISYGAFEAAPEVYQRGELEFKKLMRRLERDRMPEIVLSAPLV